MRYLSLLSVRSPLRGALVLGAVALSACAPSPKAPGDDIKENLATMRAERSVDKLLARGRGFASVGDESRAEQYLSAAIDAGGNPAEILPELLKVCIAARRYRVAIDYAKPWLDQNPKDAKLRLVLASLHATVGDAAAAQADFEQVVQQEPNDAAAHYAYAVVLHDQLGEIVKADEEFRAYLRLEPNGKHAEAARASLLKSVQ